jgi:hypothetical protein
MQNRDIESMIIIIYTIKQEVANILNPTNTVSRKIRLLYPNITMVNDSKNMMEYPK